mmetsp:Transcript_20188/g.47773  ORF Transcript_20188/g.47773 Transcript_20188/m.47773 type:complete len:258 (-) Transcript_20188:202-975(-)
MERTAGTSPSPVTGSPWRFGLLLLSRPVMVFKFSCGCTRPLQAALCRGFKKFSRDSIFRHSSSAFTAFSPSLPRSLALSSSNFCSVSSVTCGSPRGVALIGLMPMPGIRIVFRTFRTFRGSSGWESRMIRSAFRPESLHCFSRQSSSSSGFFRLWSSLASKGTHAGKGVSTGRLSKSFSSAAKKRCRSCSGELRFKPSKESNATPKRAEAASRKALSSLSWFTWVSATSSASLASSKGMPRNSMSDKSLPKGRQCCW